MFPVDLYELKRIVKGQQPVNPLESPARATQVLLASFIQGGGAGIYEDFLLSERSRFGGGLAETLVGPVASGIGEWDQLRGLAMQGDAKAGDVLKIVVNSMPLVNLWYTRTALDYLILYHLQEMMSPGILRSREKQMERERGIRYIVPPSTTVPRGGF